MCSDVRPGEIIIINEGNIKSLNIDTKATRRFKCSFEYVYLARPDSDIDGRSVYDVRLKLGQKLAKTSLPSRRSRLRDAR